jgi:hypothetical protein
MSASPLCAFRSKGNVPILANPPKQSEDASPTPRHPLHRATNIRNLINGKVANPPLGADLRIGAKTSDPEAHKSPAM